MKPRLYFPLGKASGAAFCNRDAETKKLIGNIQSGKHTFIAAPRRYGKSSLCEKAMILSEFAHSKVDLYIATTEKEIERCILKGVSDLIGQSIGNVEKAIQGIKHTFKTIEPKLSICKAGFKLEFDIESKATTPETLKEALLVLDKLLITKNKQAVLLIDEFQRVVEVAKHMGIEGGIRSAAQETQNLSIIFSGSNRHMIESIFQDEGRPLYKLCKKIKLERISAEHYKSHLNAAAISMWKKPLPDEVFSQIMLLSEQHPYYVNYLCDSLWGWCEQIPTPKDILEVWGTIIEEERSDLVKDYFGLPENQKKLFKYIALHPGDSIYTIQASRAMSIPTTSIPHALNKLLSTDMVEYHADKQVRVVNPAYKTLLEPSTQFNGI